MKVKLFEKINKDKGYRYINLILIAIYMCVFIVSVISGRFEDGEPIILFCIGFILFLNIVKTILKKFKKFNEYVYISVITGILMLFWPFNGGGGTWISFPWYILMEFIFSSVILTLVMLVFIINLITKLYHKIKRNH